MIRIPRPLGLIVLASAAIILTSCQGLVSTTNPGGSGNQVEKLKTASPVKHLIVVVMQNHSFDNLFGKFPGDVDGIQPGVPGYTEVDASGASHTPILLTDDFGDMPHGRNVYLQDYNNGAMDKFIVSEGTANALGFYDDSNPGVALLWSTTKQFALADKFFASAMATAPANPLFMVASGDNDNPDSVLPNFGPCNTTSNGGTIAPPYTFTNVGDQLTTAGVPWGWFQEDFGQCGDYVPQENPFQFFTSTHSSPNVTDYLNFKANLDVDQIPAVSFIQIGPAKDTHPGSGSGSLATGLGWLNTFIQHVQSTPEWSNTAIIVLWDEGGGFWDHVPPPQVGSQGYGFRVPMLVISPFAKKGYVSHVVMDDTSVLKFIHWNWGVSSLGGIEDQAGDIRDMFDFTQTP